MNKFLVNCLNFELDLKKLGKTKIKTKNKKRAGMISSSPIFNYSKNLWPFEKIF